MEKTGIHLKMPIPILIIIIPGTLFLCLGSDSVFNEFNKSTTSLHFNQYKSYGSYKYNYYDIKWSFNSSNQNIGITVLALDYLNYQKFEMNDSTVHYYVLSNGMRYQDKDVFSVPYNHFWVILFLNLDPDQESASVTLSVETYLRPLIFYIIPSIVAFSLIFMFILIYVISKKFKKESYALVPLFFITVSYSYYMLFMLTSII